jgi:(2Fe-2S) ferredoxin
MDKLDLTTLETKRKELSVQPRETEIVVSLGTCGVAAGGETVFQAFEKEISRHSITGVVLKKTGCLGSCYNEPNLVVRMKDLPDVIYGNVTDELVRRILEQHVAGQEALDGQAMTMPASDATDQVRKEQNK